MNKSLILTFSISVIVFAMITAVTLMILLPKQLVSLKTSVDKYQAIEKSNYTYTKTKDISKEALLKEYKVSYDDMANFRNEYKYIPGNSDPFSRGDATNTNNGTSSNSNGTNNNSESVSNASQEATQKTTNSNGGIANPASTNK